MKLKSIFVVMYCCFFFSCSSKEQWRLKNQENNSWYHSADAHQMEYILKEWVDSLSHRIFHDMESFESWDLHGNVCIDPDGYLRTDHAEIRIWSNNQKVTHLLDLQKLYQEDVNEIRQRTEEESRLKRNIKAKSKSLLNFTFFLMVLILLGLFFWYLKKLK